MEGSTKLIKVRKVARLLLGVGKPIDDESLLRFGGARTRLLWRKGWQWNESALHGRLPIGLQGGPILSLDVPLGVAGKLFSLETCVSSFRYVFADPKTRRLTNEELIDPKRLRQSLEAGLYLNVLLGPSR